ncbi:MAG: PorP/SprF family type IX secretion system membrane protein [Flavobacteriales bacterium]
MVRNTTYIYKLVLIVAVFFSSIAYAQDIHFTQFYEPQLTLNPANTGRFVGSWRANGIYRNQWGSISKPFVTTALSFDKQFQIKEHTIGLGAFYAFDQSASQTLFMNKLMLSGAYHRAFGFHQISAGLQVGYTNRFLNYNKLSYPGQFDNSIGAFNTTLTNGESFANASSNYFDFNSGVNFKTRINEKLLAEGGLAIFHWNYPKETFNGAKTNKIPPRYVFSGGANYNLNPKSFVSAHVLYMYKKKASDLVVAAHYNYRLAPNKSNVNLVFGGLATRTGFARNTDALAVIVGAEIQSYRVGLAYDVNISKLSTSTYFRGAFELSVTYIAPYPSPSKYTIPCDIY